MKVEFHCNLHSGACETKIVAVNVDTTTGFNHVHNHYYTMDGTSRRDSHRIYGVRVVAVAVGFGRKASPFLVVLQISSGVALLALAEWVTDFCLANVVPEKRAYRAQKVDKTEILPSLDQGPNGRRAH